MPQTPSLDPMTAPLQEVLDWLAEQDGWTWGSIGWVKPMLDADPGSPAFRKAGGMHECNNGHPITLDRLAVMLPDKYNCAGGRLHEYGTRAGKPCDRGGFWFKAWVPLDGEWQKPAPSIGHDFGYFDTELEARARVVAAVRMRSENV